MKILNHNDDENSSRLYFLLPVCLLVLACVFGTIGCSTKLLKGSKILEDHAIIVDKSGKPYLPIEQKTCDPSASCDDSRHWATLEEETYLTNAYDVYLDGLIQSVKKHFGNEKRNLLLFIHGGLNGQENNERARQLADQIKKETKGEYYPIFVNWNSALGSSYGEHLISVRQGKTDRWAWATSPTYLATDLGRGLLRAPFVWWSIVKNDITSTSSEFNPLYDYIGFTKERENANKIAATIEKTSDKNFQLWLGPEIRPTFWKDRVLVSTITTLTYPIKLLSSPWIDALGKSAWENMLRRTDLLFHTEKDFQANPPQFVASDSQSFEASITTCESLVHQKQGFVHRKPSGALSIFFRKLVAEILAESQQEDDDSKWSITLVGHSMGAIIVNHILRDFGTCLPIDNIVFMAAASTINNYADSVFPYMAWRIKEQESDRTKIVPSLYHLMLHETAEARETNFWNLPPTGSLLVWIDNFLSTPYTPMDLTSGRFINLMQSLHTTPEEIRPYITIKRFPGGGSSRGGVRNGIPTNHSDFAERFRFWEKACWQIPRTGNEENKDEKKVEKEKFENEKSKKCFYNPANRRNQQ